MAIYWIDVHRHLQLTCFRRILGSNIIYWCVKKHEYTHRVKKKKNTQGMISYVAYITDSLCVWSKYTRVLWIQEECIFVMIIAKIGGVLGARLSVLGRKKYAFYSYYCCELYIFFRCTYMRRCTCVLSPTYFHAMQRSPPNETGEWETGFLE